MVWLVAMVAVGQQSGAGFFPQVIPHPTGKNGYEEYVRAAVLASQPDVAQWDQGDKAFVGNASRLERNQWVLSRLKPAMELIRMGNAKPVFEPRETYTAATLLPELTYFRRLSKVLAGAAHADFAAGRSNQGTERLLDSLVFADNVSRTGSMMNHLVGSAQLSITFGSFESRLPQLSKPDCQRVIQSTSALLDRPSAYATVLENEYAMSLEGLSDLMNGKESLIEAAEFQDLAKKLQAKTPGEREEIRKMAAQLIKDKFGPVIQAYRGPESRWPLQGPDSLTETPKGFPDRPEAMAEVLAEVFAPVTTQGGTASLRSRTQMRLLRLHAWVLAFKWEHDRLPTTLEEAVPKEAIADPANGQTFEYTIVPGGYRLQSMGRDGTGEIALRYQHPVPKTPATGLPPQ